MGGSGERFGRNTTAKRSGIQSGVICRQLQQGLFFAVQRLELARNPGALVHFKRLVTHIALNVGFGLQLQQFARMDRPEHPSVDDDVVGMDDARNGCRLGNHKDAGVIRIGPDVSDHFTVHAQSFRKGVIAFNQAPMGNQALDGGLLLFSEDGEFLEDGRA
jgi:hypothetical protein